MKCTIPEISWHNREPILSVDIFPENRDFYRLASGGGDCHVLIWQMNITANGAVNQEVITDLTRHQRAVNCVRWSNTGQYLASGDDDANIIVWQLKTDNIPLLEGDTGDKETWIIYKVMRGHKEDVYDLCWSMDGLKIFSGSVDNTAILWDVHKGKMDHILTDHKGFVQGVCWDPKNQVIATISTDRTCRIFDTFGKQIKARIHKGKLSVPDGHYLQDKEVKFFHDDTFKSFFRRLHFTPDGSLLVVPSGYIEADNCKNMLNATLMFTLDNFSSPAVILPLPNQSSTVVRCCPILFELHEDGPDPIINLPYRMIFAVGSDHDIILYDTQQTVPFARFQDIHYTRLTDLTWSQDGLLLIASSTDGFCSLITFEMDELGVPWVKMESEGEENPLEISGCEELVDKDENVDTNNKNVTVEEKVIKITEDLKEESKKRPSFLEQWAIKTPKKIKLNPEEREQKRVNEKDDTQVVIEILDSPVKNSPVDASICENMGTESTDPKKKDGPINRLIPRRITPKKVEKNIEDFKVTGKPTVTNSDKKDLMKPEEKVISILTPKRIKPKFIEPTAGTSREINDASCSTQKHLELNGSEDIQNREECDNEEDSSDSDAENLSKEELEELHKASENIREFFYRVPKQQDSHSDVKPIAVRRKPKENESIVNFENAGIKKDDNILPLVNKDSDAKPIEVRRKPIDQRADKKSHRKSEDKTVVSLAKDHSDAKPIAVKRKSKNSNPEKCTSSSNLEIKNFDKAVEDKIFENINDTTKEKAEKCGKNVNSKEMKSKKNAMPHSAKKAENKTSEDTVIVIESDSTEEYSTTPKKLKSVHSKLVKKASEDRPPKIKVYSLVKQKSADKTPKKPNSLLNFLQKSAAKKTKKKKEDKEEVHIDLSLEENEARDAWSDSKQGEGQSGKKNEDTRKTVLVDDDKTEDFCLQLEDSQEGCDEEKTKSHLSESGHNEINKSNEFKNKVVSKASENNSNVDSGSVHNMEETCLTSNTAMPKTPRRVPLIILASPKGKTNKKITNNL